MSYLQSFYEVQQLFVSKYFICAAVITILSTISIIAGQRAFMQKSKKEYTINIDRFWGTLWPSFSAECLQKIGILKQKRSSVLFEENNVSFTMEQKI